MHRDTNEYPFEYAYALYTNAHITLNIHPLKEEGEEEKRGDKWEESEKKQLRWWWRRWRRWTNFKAEKI